jgi:hypothetical protein
MRCVINATSRPLYSRERDPVPIAQEAGWDSVTVWMGAENIVPTGIPFADCPAHSESLYRLRYPGPYMHIYIYIYIYIYVYIYNVNFARDVPIIYVKFIIIVIVFSEKK